jgi:hypothetical protein
MEDYYPDEIPIIMQEYTELNKAEEKGEETVMADDF